MGKWDFVEKALQEKDEKIFILTKIIKQPYTALEKIYSQSPEGRDYLEKMKQVIEGEKDE